MPRELWPLVVAAAVCTVVALACSAVSWWRDDRSVPTYRPNGETWTEDTPDGPVVWHMFAKDDDA